MATKPPIGTTIRRLRLERGLTQATLADAAGTATETISRVERGRMPAGPGLVARIASALRVEQEVLLEGRRTKPTKVRPGVARLTALADQLTDAEVDDVVRSLKAMIRIGRRLGPERRRRGEAR